jgi:hypothetical protein
MPTPADVAKWMLAELDRDRALYQEDAVWTIRQTFGESFICENQNGNLAITKDVLSEFRKLTEGSVVWVKSDRYWRRREDHDGVGRNQED